MPLVRVQTCSCPGPFKDYLGYRDCINRCASLAGKPRPSWGPTTTDGGLILAERTATRPLTRSDVVHAIELTLVELRADFPSFIHRLAVKVVWQEGR